MLATLLCAAPLVAAPAHASNDLLERTALREVLHRDARAGGSGGVVALPLPEPARAAAAGASRELAALARSADRERVLVGVRRHADLRGVAAELRRLGSVAAAFRAIGVLAATVPSGAELVARLRGHRGVAYIERDRELSATADPFDVVDPNTGIKYTWAYDDVRAGEALAAAGGGSRRTVAIIDTGLDVRHPELVGRIARPFNALTGGPRVRDNVGHGTFVAGLISAIDGNGIGGKGVAGATRLIPIRGSFDGNFTVQSVLVGIDYSLRRGVDVLNLSLAGRSFSRSLARAFEVAFFNDVLPVAASGNRALRGNPLEYPAADVGGVGGGRGIGLSVAASTPAGQRAVFSNYNRYVSLAAPGAGPGGCRFGVFSTLPRGPTVWDDPNLSCSLAFSVQGARYAYGEGTSFAAPIAAGIAALVWQVEPRLASEQVGEVLTRSARQTVSTGWNSGTGAGIVDGKAAADFARVYDVTDPGRLRAAARRRGGAVAVTVRATRDRTEAGRELAGGLRYGLLVARGGGGGFRAVLSARRPFTRRLRLRGRGTNVFVATACDRNGNCTVKRLGRFRP